MTLAAMLCIQKQGWLHGFADGIAIHFIQGAS